MAKKYITMLIGLLVVGACDTDVGGDFTVVHIHSTDPTGNYPNRTGRQAGVVLGDNGFVLATEHGIVDNYTREGVTFEVLPDGHEYTSYTAVLVAVDRDNDMVLLRIIDSGHGLVSDMPICNDVRPLQHVEAHSVVASCSTSREEPGLGYMVKEGWTGYRVSAAKRIVRSNTPPGYSGGPVIRTKDECIVGVVSVDMDGALPRVEVATPLGSPEIRWALERYVPEVL